MIPYEAHPGQVCNIVGKGPSIEHLAPGHLIDGFTLAINDAVLKCAELGAHDLYSLQKDAMYDPSEMLPVPESATLITWDMQDLGLYYNEPSVVCAAVIGRLMGASLLVFRCCDAVTRNDYRTWTAEGVSSIEESAAEYPTFTAKLFEVLNHQVVPYRFVP